MPKRTAVNTIHIQRDGKTIVVNPGTVYDFTGEELADINASSPESVRTPVNEDTADAAVRSEASKAKAAEQEKANEAARKEAEVRALAAKKPIPNPVPSGQVGKSAADL